LLCHNDLSPANTIYVAGKPQAFIDWDLAVPSTASWDLAYAARTFVPLYVDQDCSAFGYDPAQRGSRLRLFCDAYGMSRAGRRELLPLMHRRLAVETSPFAQRCQHALTEYEQTWSRQLD
jgi:aminoglycoside phosphotransferase (APT) family kinase protein